MAIKGKDILLQIRVMATSRVGVSRRDEQGAAGEVDAVVEVGDDSTVGKDRYPYSVGISRPVV